MRNFVLKKWTALLLCFVLLLSATACEKKTGPDADGTYTTAVLDTSADEGKLTARYLELHNVYNANGDKVNVGDCVVYTSPEGLIMVVDCSNKNSYEEIDRQLTAMGVTKIDIFVMSHPHADHIGCFAQLAAKYPIGQLYKNLHEYGSGTYAAAMDAVKANNIPCTVLHEGDTFDFGAQVKVKVYGPTAEMEANLSEETDNANDCSLAMRLTYGDSSFWTSGDMYLKSEQAVVDKYGSEIQSDIVKMNHHGYDTSNGTEYIDTLQPKVAVGMHESITSKTTALRYVRAGAVVFYNTKDGAIRVSTAGDGAYDVQCQIIRENTMYGEPAADGHYVIGKDQ